jgi:hypothetical protein
LTAIFDSVINFTSKDCKSNRHQNCPMRWDGLGFEFACSCICHYKKVGVLDEIPQSAANTRLDHSDKYGDIRSE